MVLVLTREEDDMTGRTRRKHDKKTDGAVDGGQRDTMKTHKHVNSDDLFK